jgi:hypothetical protein
LGDEAVREKAGVRDEEVERRSGAGEDDERGSGEGDIWEKAELIERGDVGKALAT